MLLIGSDK